MQYLYHKQSGAIGLELTGDEHRYLFKVRRHRQGDRVALRNLEDDYLYWYEVISLDKRHATLQLIEQEERVVSALKSLHIGWCLIDPKRIERVLPSLNEMGVARITFIACARSQRQFKLDFKRLEKILLNSSQQSGRSVLMELAFMEDLKHFLQEHPDAVMINFSQNQLSDHDPIKTVVVGCEGGFSPEEVAYFGANRVVGFQTPLILRSESAVCAVASKLLL